MDEFYSNDFRRTHRVFGQGFDLWSVIMRNLRTLGFRIKDARLKAGMTVSEVADISGFPYEDLLGVERGTRLVDFSGIMVLAERLNTTVKDLIESMSDEEYMRHILGNSDNPVNALDSLLNYMEDYIYAERLRLEKFVREEILPSLQEPPKLSKKNIFEDEEGEL